MRDIIQQTEEVSRALKEDTQATTSAIRGQLINIETAEAEIQIRSRYI